MIGPSGVAFKRRETTAIVPVVPGIGGMEPPNGGGGGEYVAGARLGDVMATSSLMDSKFSIYTPGNDLQEVI